MLEVHVTITAVAVLAVILLLFLIGLLFYIYPSSNKETTVPGPAVSDIRDGNRSDIDRAGSLHQYLCNLHAEHGDLASFHFDKQLIISIADSKYFAPRSQVFQLPDFLYEFWEPMIGKESFVFSQGVDVFKRRDNIDFKVDKKVKEFYAKIFRLLAIELEEKWRKQPEDQHIPLTQHLKGLATKAVCQMMFGESFADDERVIKLYKAWDKCWNEVMAASKMEPTKSESDEKKSIKELRSLMEKAIEERWKKSKHLDGITLLDGLLASSNSSVSPLSSEQLLCDVITMFTIGVQVTNAVLCWSVYFIAAHDDVQTKLRNKLNEVESLDIMPQSLNEMKYMQSIIKESIRCSGVFSYSGRVEDIDITVGDHLVPKGTPIIEALMFPMQSDAFESPDMFNPKNFSDATKSVNPLTYIPFAFGGSRHKPQDSLVYLLVSITVASLFRTLRISLAGKEVDPQSANYESFVALPSTEEVWVTVGGKLDVETVGENN
uniref:cytochrome P450 20A1 n=1 Tax=Ciona intestinalis TaxID=7719 RepID=UPI000180C5DC|nr:cytochrome P450 20A1 [Ciona intestinalis]|eukprot:XP_002120646.1 cytochrome P450 20A1 [Ciona intestinalis]